MKVTIRILLFLIFIMLFSCAKNGNNSKNKKLKISNNKTTIDKPKLKNASNKETSEKDIEIQTITKNGIINNFEIAKFQNFNDITNFIRNHKGANPENFSLGPYAYVNGEDGELNRWNNFDDRKKKNLKILLSEFNCLKLDYSDNPNNVSAALFIGPIKSCNEYNIIIKRIKELHLNFPNVLAHDLKVLSDCVDFN